VLSIIKKGDITIDTMYVKINETDITVYAHAKYKNIPLLISSRDVITYNDKYIIVNPLNFKVGLLPLPKGLIMDGLKKLNIRDIEINDKSMEIEKSRLAINVKTIEVNNNKIIMTLPKLNIMGSVEKVIEEESKIYSPPVSNNGDKNISNNSSTTKTNKPSGSNPKKVTVASNRKAILKRASGQLSAAAGSVSSSSSRRIIGYAKSAINKMISNPNYQYQGDLMSAKVLYDKLSSVEQEKIKAAIFSHVDTKALLNVVNKK